MPLKRIPVEPRDHATSSFDWFVDKTGYQIRRMEFSEHFVLGSRSKKGPGVGAVLVPKGFPKDNKRYQPLKNPELFREFSNVEPGHESIVAFANEYGELGDPVRVKDRFGEVVDTWEGHIIIMKNAVRLLDGCQQGREHELDSLIQRFADASPATQKEAGALGVGSDFTGWLFVERDEKDRARGVDPINDPHGRPLSKAEAAKHAVAELANEFLHDNCTAELERLGRDSTGYKICVKPKTLLGAMWWQVAQIATGRADRRPCKVCGNVMEISTGRFGARINREFCSDACKVKDYRGKMKRARELAAGGVALGAIAKELGTKVVHVRKWLAR